MTKLTKAEADAIGKDIEETQIVQMLNGLRQMPLMLPRLREMAGRDPTAAEVVRRYEAEQ